MKSILLAFEKTCDLNNMELRQRHLRRMEFVASLKFVDFFGMVVERTITG
jgi:hypothetical protein